MNLILAARNFVALTSEIACLMRMTAFTSELAYLVWLTSCYMSYHLHNVSWCSKLLAE